jgi:hypothetical protein
MAQASAGLKSLGVPIDKIGSANAAGLITSATKSLPDVAKFAKGLPLPPDIKAGIDKAVGLSAYAVKLTDIKIPAVFKAETKPTPAADTANRETVNAATNRVIGNEKIPAPSYGPKVPVESDVNADIAAIEDAYSEVIGYIVGAIADLTDLKRNLVTLSGQSSVSRADFDAANALYNKIRNEHAGRGVRLINAANGIRNTKSDKAQLATNSKVADVVKYSEEFAALLAEVKELLKTVEAKLLG